jgi:hypothetical protein
LRAQFYGITGNAVDLGGEYRWHESGRSPHPSARLIFQTVIAGKASV